LEYFSSWPRRGPIVATVIGLLGALSLSDVVVAQSPGSGDRDRDRDREAATPGRAADVQRILNQALLAAGQIAATSERALVLAGIAQAQTDLGDREAALSTLSPAVQNAEAVLDGTRRVALLRLDARVLVELGARKGAQGMIQRATQRVRSLTDRRKKLEALAECAQALAEVGDEESAREALGDALTIAKSLPDERERNAALARLADGQVRLGDLGNGVQTITEITQAGESIRPSFLEAMLDALKEKDALSVRRALNEAAAPTDETTRPVAMLYAGLAVAQRGDLYRAGEIFDELNRCVRLPTISKRLGPTRVYSYRKSCARILAAVAVAQAEMGQTETAARTCQTAIPLAQGLQPHDQIECKGQIARALAKIGDFKGALELVRTLAAPTADPTDKPLPSTFPGFVWRERALRLVEVADLLAAAGQRDDARSVLRQTSCADGSKEDRDQVDVLLALAAAQLKLGDSEGAGQNWSRALQYVKSPEGWSSLAALPPEVALSRFALERARARDSAWVLRTTAALERIRFGGIPQCRALADVAVVQAESGDLEGAQNTVLLIPDTGTFEALPAWEAIARTRAKSGDAGVAAKWAAGLSPVSFKASALLGVAKGLLARGAGPAPRPAR
jgi:tetratricopeptide (TPR) repeat protein